MYFHFCAPATQLLALLSSCRSPIGLLYRHKYFQERHNSSLPPKDELDIPDVASHTWISPVKPKRPCCSGAFVLALTGRQVEG